MKKIVILGSTGSIGVAALDVVSRLGPGYEVIGLAANSNYELLAEQARSFRPQYVTLFDEAASENALGLLPRGSKLLPPGLESLMTIASLEEADIVVHAMSGGVGFAPLVAAIKAGKTIALANKEPIVMAGAALMKECERWEARIIPVDSEPSAIFQCLGDRRDSLESLSRVLLTASGGPFFRRRGSLDRVTPKEALRHPRWKMGRKITVDSATLMNKGFEAMEMQTLFGLPLSKIKIVVHPQSIIHSAVEFCDGSVLAQMSLPDMRLPIQYAITYPSRQPSRVEKLDLFSLRKLEFFEPDFRRFPCLSLALESARLGGTFPAVLSAADEVAVEAFLAGEIRFTDIARVVEAVLRRNSSSPLPPSLAEAVEADSWARVKTADVIAGGHYRKKTAK